MELESKDTGILMVDDENNDGIYDNIVHVEVCLLPNSTADFQEVEEHVFTMLHSEFETFFEGEIHFSGDTLLEKNVYRIRLAMDYDHSLSRAQQKEQKIPPWKALEATGKYLQLSQDMNERLEKADSVANEEGRAEESTEEDESTNAFSQWTLPAKEFDGLWETLVYDTNIQNYLLSYAETALLFAEKQVNTNLISWNKVVLLHGPPGTGKTSLCKALAQKLSIRLCKNFATSLLLEINSHSLFSKWFSESGKLVSKLFAYVNELVEDTDCLVCILIDEVESLAAARSSAASGSEPSDSIRVVNALLTQIDQLKQKSNVIILTTSNITQTIDLAFVDRADIKQFIGLPCTVSRYAILKSCIEELKRVELLSYPLDSTGENIEKLLGRDLWKIAESTEGFSGRALRKLPFQAYASLMVSGGVPLPKYFAGLRSMVAQEKVNNYHLKTQ